MNRLRDSSPAGNGGSQKARKLRGRLLLSFCRSSSCLCLVLHAVLLILPPRFLLMILSRLIADLLVHVPVCCLLLIWVRISVRSRK